MQEFCAQVRSQQVPQQAKLLADRFETGGDWAQAAEFAALGQQFERAARLYIKVRPA